MTHADSASTASTPRLPRLEPFVAAVAALGAGALALPWPLPVTAAWVALIGVLHGLAPRTRAPFADGLRITLLALSWAAGPALAAPGVPLWVASAAACVALATALAASRALLAAEHSARAAHDTARSDLEHRLRQATDEVARLRIDLKTGHDVYQQISQQLQETSDEASLLRSKAEALATTLQRVMPYEMESGLLTAEKFNTVLEREAARMQRQELPLTMVLVKLDHFAEFERGYGRVAYEAVIRRVSEILHKSGNRPGDVAGRLDEHTFALLYPEADHHNGFRLAEAIRTRLVQLGVRNEASPHGLVTASLGCATVLPSGDTDAGTLRERAESALYEAGFQDGNRCVRYRLAQAVRVEHWDLQNEGALTPDSLRHKLALLGYSGKPRRLAPGESQRERRVVIDTVKAIVEGNLKISLEGEARMLRPGDCLYLPKGTVTREEVIGDKPVICFEGVLA
ncbi:MAG: diguanylate cyclase [Gammaproteobacteria bacterium]